MKKKRKIIQREEDIIRILSNRLHALRIQKEITQKEMGDILNVSAQTVSGYENGTILPGILILLKYCEFFEIDLNYLLGLEETSKREVFYPTHHEIQMLMGYRRRPDWLQRSIRTLCFAGTHFRNEEDD